MFDKDERARIKTAFCRFFDEFVPDAVVERRRSGQNPKVRGVWSAAERVLVLFVVMFKKNKRLSSGWRKARGFRFQPASTDSSVRMTVDPNAFCVRTQIARAGIYGGHVCL